MFHTPCQADRMAKQELKEAPLADPQELKAIEHEYGSSYAALSGEYIHTMIWSHLDLGYSVIHMARYTPVPSKVTFVALKCIALY